MGKPYLPLTIALPNHKPNLIFSSLTVLQGKVIQPTGASEQKMLHLSVYSVKSL